MVAVFGDFDAVFFSWFHNGYQLGHLPSLWEDSFSKAAVVQGSYIFVKDIEGTFEHFAGYTVFPWRFLLLHASNCIPGFLDSEVFIVLCVCRF